MNGVNLIPASRRRARAGRIQVRLWSAATIMCGVALAAAHGSLWSAWRAGHGDLAADADKLVKEIAAAQKQEKMRQAEVQEAKAAADAAREVSDQPDWGVLLSFVAGRLGPEVALDSFRLEPAKRVEAAAAPAIKAPAVKPPQQAPPARAGRYTLVLTGMARTQDAASDVAIKLKQTDLFEGVSLVETRRTGFMGGEAVAFRIECAITGAGGGE